MRRAFSLRRGRPGRIEGMTGATGTRHRSSRLTDFLFSVTGALVVWVVASTPMAQSTTGIKGVVTDARLGTPVEGARVRLGNGSAEMTSLTDGTFAFDHLSTGWYDLEVSAEGYEQYTTSDIHVTTDVTRQLVIRLESLPVEVPGITVRATRPDAPSTAETIIDRSEIDKARPQDVAELLEHVPGVTVQRSAGSSSGVRVSIRGSASRHVVIMVNGHPINNGSDGEADLGSIPMASIQRIEVYRGGASVEHGPGALGGAINIITGPMGGADGRYQYLRSSGSFGAGRDQVLVDQPIASDSLTTSLLYERRVYTGDFPYRYNAPPASMEYSGASRENNDETSQALSGTAEYHHRDARSLRLSMQIADTDRGLPGRASLPSPDARSSDDRLTVTGEWEERFTQRLRTSTSVGLSRYVQRFADPGDPEVFRRAYDSEFRNSVVSARSSVQVVPFVGQEMIVGAQLQVDEFEQKENLAEDQTLGITRRVDMGMFAISRQEFALPAWAGFDNAVVEGSIRHDHVATRNKPTGFADTATSRSLSFWSPRVGASVSWGGEVSRLTIRGSYGKSISLPTMNALFWKSDARSAGNPELRPEKAEHSDVSAEFSTTYAGVKLSGAVAYFHTFYYDLVQWQPDFQGIWKPYNLAGALVTGHEDEFSFGVLNDQLQVLYRNTVTDAANREPGANSYGNQLTHVPHYHSGITVRLNHRLVDGEYSVRWVDRRYANASNQWWYDDYRIDDVRLGINLPHKDWIVEFDYRAENIQNTDYTLITHYPMPPREWQVGVSLTYNPGGNSNGRQQQ